MARIWHGVALLAASLAAAPSSAQTLRSGVLLIASPDLRDPNFERSVVLILGTGEDGSIGIVVNRRTRLEPGAVFSELAPSLGAYDGRLYRGGPVSPVQLVFLLRGLAAAVVQGPAVLDDIYVSGNPDQLSQMASLAEDEHGMRLYAGHAAWVAGQLEQEIADGSWCVIEGNADLVFSEDPRRIWESAVALTSELVVRH